MQLTRKILFLPVWLWATIVIIAVGGAAYYTINQPKHAGWRYGACKVFLEHYVRFPTTINMREGGESRGSAVLSFSDRNPYGSEQVRSFECYFSHENGHTKLSRITLDRKALPDDIVARYNDMLPVLLGVELDTALPKDVPDDLEALKEDK
jgi:hypothetical protein